VDVLHKAICSLATGSSTHTLSRSADARTTEPIGSVGDSITP
jgi:hypothetical protein